MLREHSPIAWPRPCRRRPWFTTISSCAYGPINGPWTYALNLYFSTFGWRFQRLHVLKLILDDCIASSLKSRWTLLVRTSLLLISGRLWYVSNDPTAFPLIRSFDVNLDVFLFILCGWSLVCCLLLHLFITYFTVQKGLLTPRCSLK